jgi:hypothetical protein
VESVVSRELFTCFSLVAEMSADRPAGITAIVAMCLVLGVGSLVYAGLIAAGRTALSAGAWLLGGGLEQLGPLAFLTYAAIVVGLAVALWKRWRWARRGAILVAAIGIALAVPALSSAVMDSRVLGIAREGVQIVVRVLVIFYFSQEPVKEWFSHR